MVQKEKTLMKKQQKQFMILILVLALLCAGFFALKQYNKTQAQKPKEETGEIIIDTTVEEVTKLSYDFEGNTYDLEKKDGIWYDTQDNSLKISQTLIEGMLSNVVKLRAQETIADVTDMEQYGLKEPSGTISIDTQSKAITLLAGDYNSVSGYYYVCFPGETTVYAVDRSVIEGFNYTVEELIEEETEPEAAGTVQSSLGEMEKAVSQGDGEGTTGTGE